MPLCIFISGAKDNLTHVTFLCTQRPDIKKLIYAIYIYIQRYSIQTYRHIYSYDTECKIETYKKRHWKLITHANIKTSLSFLPGPTFFFSIRSYFRYMCPFFFARATTDICIECIETLRNWWRNCGDFHESAFFVRKLCSDLVFCLLQFIYLFNYSLIDFEHLTCD